MSETALLFDIDQHKIENLSNNGWDDDPDWTLICACGWETWGAREEWIAIDRHDDHVVDEFKNFRKVNGV